MTKRILIGVAVTFIATLAFSCITSQVLSQPINVVAQEQKSLSRPTDIVVARNPQERVNLERFDYGTLEGINNRNMTALRELHTPGVLAVGFGEGFGNNITKGIEPHLEDVKPTAEGLKILAHPIKIAAGNWTVVTGQTSLENVSMVTVARWEDNRIAEEYVFFSEANLLDPMILGQQANTS